MELKGNNGGMIVRNSASGGGMAPMSLDVEEAYYVADEHSLSGSPAGMQQGGQRRMLIRPGMGQFGGTPGQQRFPATSRLIDSAQLQETYTPQGRLLGALGNAALNNGYAVKRPFADYGMLDYSFRIKFPRHTDKSRGLRHFSNKVCEKVKEKGQTNYNEVAEELVAEYFDSLPDPPSSVEKQQYDTKNIRRRVYDALNVLMAMNIIEKDKKEIHWVGLPTSSFAECRRLEEEKAQRQDRLRQKTEQLQELIIQLVAYKSLVQRNRERERAFGRPADAAILYLPYIIVNTEKKTMVDCAISSDKTEYWFNFDRPFEIHDDIEVLKRLGLAYGLDSGMVAPENVSHVKSCLPPALRDYIDQIIEGTLSGGVISKTGKGSQTVVISANQQERKPLPKFANADNLGMPARTTGHPNDMANRSYGPGPGTQMMAPRGGAGMGGQVARYAVVPRTATYSNTNARYSQPMHPSQQSQIQHQKQPAYSGYGGGDRMTMATTSRPAYAGQSTTPSSQQFAGSGRTPGYGQVQRSSYGTYQDTRHPQQQQIYAQEMQQPMEDYMEEELYDEETHEY